MKKMIFLLFLLLLLPVVQAGTCVDSDTLQYDMPYEDDSGPHTLKVNTTCVYGCEDGACIDGNTDNGLMFIIGIGILAFIFAYIAFNLDKEEHGYMQLLLYMMAFLMMLAMTFVLMFFANIGTHPGLESVFTTLMQIVMVCLALNMLYFLWKFFEGLLIKYGIIRQED